MICVCVCGGGGVGGGGAGGNIFKTSRYLIYIYDFFNFYKLFKKIFFIKVSTKLTIIIWILEQRNLQVEVN